MTSGSSGESGAGVVFPESMVEGARGSFRDTASVGRSATSDRRLRRVWKSPLLWVGSCSVGFVASVYGGAGFATEVMEWGLPESLLLLPSRCCLSHMAPMELRSSWEMVSRENLVVVETMLEARDLSEAPERSSIGSSMVLEPAIGKEAGADYGCAARGLSGRWRHILCITALDVRIDKSVPGSIRDTITSNAKS